MKFLATCVDHAHLLHVLNKDIDAFIIGEANLSLRLPYTYELTELVDVIDLIHTADKMVFLDMRTLITNERITHVQDVLTLVKRSQLDGIIFADPAVYTIAQELELDIPFIWGAETITTNWYSVAYWNQLGVSHVALAKELTKKSIMSIDQKCIPYQSQLEMQVFGPLTMFHSRRNLLNNYYQQLDIVAPSSKQNFLFDSERHNYYPIFEDESGTHILSPKDVCLIDELDMLSSLTCVTYLKIDAKGHDTAFMNSIFDLFIEAKNLLTTDPNSYLETKSSFVQRIQALYDSPYRSSDKGFFYKPTIY